MNEARILTVHQPWASLTALGVKRIETRSQPTKWRGPLLIHAGLHRLPVGGIHLPETQFTRDPTKRAEVDEFNRRTWFCINTITDPEFQGLQPCNPITGRQRRIPKRAQTPTLFWPHGGPCQRPSETNPKHTHTEYLPLGAVVAVADLVDCLPITDGCSNATAHICHPYYDDATLIRHTPLNEPDPATGETEHDISNELPYGDFTPPRWGWMLDNVRPLGAPVAHKGAQGLRWASDELLAECMGQVR